MNYKQNKKMNFLSLHQPFERTDGMIELDVRRNKLHSNLMSCGKKMQIGGRQITYHCRKSICAYCSNFAAKRMAEKFMSQFPDARKESFSMITLGLNYAYDAREAIAYFNQSRIDLRNGIKAIRKRKPRGKPNEFHSWKGFSMSGSLEIDAFHVKDFSCLGEHKKHQYILDYGYDPTFLSEGSVFIATYHGVIYREGLSDVDLESFFRKHAKRVHIQSLYDDQSTACAVGNVIGYGHKVDYTTCYTSGRDSLWNKETLEEYISAVSFLKGRQVYKFCIKQQIEKR